VIDLKNYICIVPFDALEIHENKNFMCCASWLLKELPNNVPLKDLWNSQEAIEIRESMLDGSFKFCDKTQCPFLSQLTNFGSGFIGPIVHKSDASNDILKLTSGKMKRGPKIFQMSFDRTCNYKCPSCRNEMIVANTEKIKAINKTIYEFEDAYSKSIETIYCSGTADPFASVSYRNYLRNFDNKKYPMLKNIHLHTNASLWDKEMWDTMPNVHEYVKTCEISIDAGTKDTYENVTRLGGNWDNLISNLKFITTIPKLEKIKVSFVVQQSNYKEMQTFSNMMKEILGKKGRIYFGKINNWGTFNADKFEFLKVWDPNHPEHQDFLNEFDKVSKDPFVFHNMQEFVIQNKKSLI
jgi:hypothetical protein